MSKQEQQIIRQWSVAGNDRIVGTVHNRPGHKGGRTIMTSPVVQVRLIGADRRPVATTESGSVYWLEEPSIKWRPGEAEAFLQQKSGVHPPPAADPPDSELQTTLMGQPRRVPA